MAEIIKVYRQSLPALRLIGERYHDSDRGPLGGFGNPWEIWYYKQKYKTLKRLGSLPDHEGSQIGCMRYQGTRFVIPDAKGNVILDYCVYLKQNPT